VRDTGDGVARIEGLSDVMLNEMIEFSSGVYGLALNLEETEVGAILLGDMTAVKEGDEAAPPASCCRFRGQGVARPRRETRSASRSTAKGPIRAEASYPLEKIAPASSSVSPVNQPVQTGIMASTR
jgi:F-type H+-transporting ATPase subunit alpha